MTLEQIRAKYDDALTRQESLLNLCENENREFTAEENVEFDTLSRSIKDLTVEMEREAKKDEAKKLIAARQFNQPKKSEERKASEKFSLVRAVKLLSEGKQGDQMDGAEGEMHQEAVNEAKAHGRSVNGFGIPESHIAYNRAQDASTAATASNLIATNLDGTVIPALYPTLFTAQLGATQMNGLVGNLDLPAGNGIATATWEGETDDAENTDPTTRLIELRPNRLAAITTVSKRLLVQGSISVEQWLRGELSGSIARAVDNAALNGNGASINGIMATSGVNEISFAGAVNRVDLVNLQTVIETQNYNGQNMAYVMNPITKGALRNLETDSGSGLFVMNNSNELLGYPVLTSTLVPTNIDSNKTAVIFGDWSNLILANWGGVDLMVDPYFLALKAQVRLIINSEWDIKLKQPKAFAFGNDITWTALS